MKYEDMLQQLITQTPDTCAKRGSAVFCRHDIKEVLSIQRKDILSIIQKEKERNPFCNCAGNIIRQIESSQKNASGTPKSSDFEGEEK